MNHTVEMARQLDREMDLRSEGRLLERRRIACDLHDTLFQGLFSASMQLHAALEHIPQGAVSMPLVTRALALIQQSIDEGRTVIQGLHSAPPEFPDLERAFADVQYKLSGQFATRFRMIIEGQPRRLTACVREEAYWIGREALVNACRHSGGQSIEMGIGYRSDRVRLVVRDNGCGIDPEVLGSGRHGHWGLVGMRERAERIKAQLRVLSRVKCGTEIELSIPGCVAFADNLAA
jgi:signal transduction histidine kinase